MPKAAIELLEEVVSGEDFKAEFQDQLLPEDHPATLIVKEISSRLIAAAGELGAHYHWRFYVVDSPQVNATCLPGGTVVVYTGLFSICETKEELAVVLAHEIAHALARD